MQPMARFGCLADLTCERGEGGDRPLFLSLAYWVRRRTICAATVSDTGTEMSPPTLAKVFDPFFTTKPIGEGTLPAKIIQHYGFSIADCLPRIRRGHGLRRR